jgi:tetratricopeptide (TPR) repeat protein
MCKIFLISILMFCPLVMAQDNDALIDQAAQLYETRYLDPANLDKGYDILKDLVANDSLNPRALSEFAHVHYILGDRAQTKKAKLDYYQKGADWGRRAIKADDRYAEAHLWYMVNLGRIGQTKGVLNSLGMVPDLKREINRALELDPRLTPALDARAMLYYELPGLFGGDLNKSLAALNQGIAIDSNYTILYVDMAKVLIKKKDFEKARWYLNRCLAVTDPTYPADCALDDKPDAERLLKEIENK